jgi:hypothetical protein
MNNRRKMKLRGEKDRYRLGTIIQELADSNSAMDVIMILPNVMLTSGLRLSLFVGREPLVSDGEQAFKEHRSNKQGRRIERQFLPLFG